MTATAGRAGGGPRYGMVVDINRCVGCQTCTISCKHVNDTPPGVQWRRVLDVEQGTFPDVERLFLVVGCQHCADPPCVPVCPTGATRQRADGLVTMDYDRCIGCGYCAVACPYQARTIVHDRSWYYGRPTRQEEAVEHRERVGVASKCTFCIEKVDDAARLGKTPGVDLAFTPACAASCITQAIKFGDFRDPESEVSRLVRENAHFQMHEALGTDPQVKYLYEVPASTPGQDARAEDLSDEALSDPEDPLVGHRQGFWDLRAAMNFTLGGMSSGLVVVASVLSAAGALDARVLARVDAAAAVGMALGLLCVFLEIGRKARFLYVLLRPQSSWMTRETYAVAVLYPAVALGLLDPGPVWSTLAALAAAGFLLCQARILHAGRGIPAWRAPQVPWLLGATGLLEGAALLALGTLAFPAAFAGSAARAGVALAGIALALLTFLAWRAYLGGARASGVGPLARRVLESLDPWLRWVGHAAPAAGFAAAAAAPASAAGVGALAAAAALALAGGIALKVGLVTRAGHQQGYAVPRLPRRGSGVRAAPIRLDPGRVRVTAER